MNYCAFLRGINVNGTSMKMAELKSVFQNLGFTDAQTILATGNVIFSSEKNADELKEVLQKKLSEYFNYDAHLFIKTEKETREILNQSPFETAENFHNYIFICDGDFGKKLHSEFFDGEEAQLIDKIFYWKIQKGNTLDSDFGKILGKKDFKPFFTSRNINTLQKISAKFLK